jgi:outer membrane protein OmpA-like peptidoglycan-associated protein
MKRRIGVSALVLALCAGSAAAQETQKGNFEVGGFARWTNFGTNFEDWKNGSGGGARVGYYISPRVTLEADGSYNRASSVVGNGTYNYEPFHFRFAYHAPIGSSVRFLFGGGYTHNEYSTDHRDDGLGGLLGLRFGLGKERRWGARLDGTIDYISYNTLPSTTHLGAQLGVSYIFGKLGPKDSDKDGVPDPSDKCPGTPLGTKVDANGCPLPLDSDGDGVTDDKDKCPGTPAGVAVDANGCPRDSDGDGVTDDKDQCPNTPAGTPVDANGCPRDSDGDGVMDSMDKCPNTPHGDFVDANGCSITKDSDGDGVPDDKDKCPATPGGDQVDALGCTIVLMKLSAKTPLILEGVNFETGKAVLLPGSQDVLDQVALSLRANPEVQVEISGFTDNTGSAATNTRLSKARAEAVRNYLTNHGVNPNNVTAKGYGPSNPVAPNKTSAGRAKNRRVEIKRTN